MHTVCAYVHCNHMYFSNVLTQHTHTPCTHTYTHTYVHAHIHHAHIHHTHIHHTHTYTAHTYTTHTYTTHTYTMHTYTKHTCVHDHLPLAFVLGSLPHCFLQACHVHNCGYDAGDCDVDKFHHLYSVDLQPDRANYSIPLGVKAMFFNLTGVFGNGTSVTKATFTTPSAVRTAVVSQKHKVLSFTFVRNVSLSSSQVLLEGKDSTGNSTIVRM